MKKLSATLLMLHIICISLFAAVLELPDRPHDNAKTVTVAGYGVDERSSLNNALIAAVEQVVGVLISSDIRIKNAELIEENVISLSNGFVQTYKTISVAKEKDVYVTTIEATVQTEKLKNTFKSLGINTIEIDDPNANYSQVVTQAKRDEDIRKYINSNFDNTYPSIDKMLQIEVVSIDFGDVNAGKVPYSINFNVSVDKQLYNEATNKVVKILSDYSVIQPFEDEECYKLYFESRKGTSAGSDYIKSFPWIDSGKNINYVTTPGGPRNNVLRIIVPDKEGYCDQIYFVNDKYRADIYRLMNKNAMDALSEKLKITVRMTSVTDATLQEHMFSFFNPPKHTLKLNYSFNKKEEPFVNWDNLTGIMGAVFFIDVNMHGYLNLNKYSIPDNAYSHYIDKNTLLGYAIMPFIVTPRSTLPSFFGFPLFDSLPMSYHGVIDVNDINKVKQVSIEFVK